MKPTLLLLNPLALLVGFTTAAHPRFKKYEECVSHCDADPACQAAYFDTITGDCQVFARVSDQTPPDRFRPYIKNAPGGGGVSASLSGQTGTSTVAAVAGTGTGVVTGVVGTGTGTETETGAGVGASPPAATETSGSGGGWGVLRGDVGVVAAAGCVVMGFLG
jgi:hypothetical protein